MSGFRYSVGTWYKLEMLRHVDFRLKSRKTIKIREWCRIDF